MELENYHLLFSLERNNWWFRGRRDLLVRTLKQFGINGIIADFGCASGSTLLAIRQFGIPVGVDMAASALVFASRKTRCCVQARIEHLPFKPGSLDCICCLDVIEHVDDDSKLMGEIRNALKSGGRMVFSVPAFNFLWSETDDMLHHKRRYCKKELHEILSSYFFIERMTYWNFFLFMPALASVVARNIARYFQPNTAKKNVLEQIPSVLNALLVLPLLFENWLVQQGLRFPFGVSIVGVVRK